MVVQIDFFTQDELADLFSIACDCSKKVGTWEHPGETIEGEGEFLTERVADILYKGGTIDLVDGLAEDEEDSFGGYPTTWHPYDAEDGSPEVMLYPVKLKDRKERLQKTMDKSKEVGELFVKAKNDLGDIDEYDAWMIMQGMMFGDYIYG